MNKRTRFAIQIGGIAPWHQKSASQTRLRNAASILTSVDQSSVRKVRASSAERVCDRIKHPNVVCDEIVSMHQVGDQQPL